MAGTAGTQSRYLRLAACRFAYSYLKGRSVAYLEGEDPNHASSLLAGLAKSVTVLSESAPPSELAAGLDYQSVILPGLPYPDAYFEAVVAFGIVEGREDPEAVIREASRVLGESGTLVLCTPEKQIHTNDRNRRDPRHRRTLYVLELRELLERHFREVRLYRIGAVAGGLVSELEAGGLCATEIDDTPAGEFVLAICGPEANGRGPRLTLDRDGRTFEELEAAREEARLLRAEIRQMQQTEVRAFRDALALERNRASKLGKELEEARESSRRLLEENGRLKAANSHLQTRLQQIEASRAWRALGLYRRLRGGLGG